MIRRVQPNYPPLAKQARIQGQVVLQAEISKDGTIQNLQLISGHPMLAPAAIEAVKQWRYKPYLLNGEPVARGDHGDCKLQLDRKLDSPAQLVAVKVCGGLKPSPSHLFPRRETLG